MSEVVVVAVFTAKPGHEREVEEALGRLIPPTHDEPGCITYALHRGLDDPASFAIVERWTSRAALDEHFTRPHMAAVAGAAEHLAEPPKVLFSEALAMGDPEKGAI
ncbi:MAG: antibiotic biosynthesis monooxygenase [Thermoleophilaceae bacterium]|nr:antibiotic biosynthesis monooxygenase [Thermoleophilaceae bacterium]